MVIYFNLLVESVVWHTCMCFLPQNFTAVRFHLIDLIKKNKHYLCSLHDLYFPLCKLAMLSALKSLISKSMVHKHGQYIETEGSKAGIAMWLYIYCAQGS